MAKLLRINSVVQKVGLAKSTIWMMCKEDRFPRPIKISERVTVWKEEDIDKWIEGVYNENGLQKTSV